MNLGVLLALLTGVGTLVGNIFAKEWSLKNQPTMFAFALLSYLVSVVIFPFSLKYGGVSVLNALSALAAIVATAIVGVLWFKEVLTTPHAIGISLGVISVILLMIPQRS